MGIINSHSTHTEVIKSGRGGKESQGILDTTLESQSKITHVGIQINREDHTKGREFGGIGGSRANLLQSHKAVFELRARLFVFIDGREFSKERVIILKQRGVRFEKCLAPFCGTTAKAGDEVGDTKFTFVFRKGQMVHTDVQLGLLQKWVKLRSFPIKGRWFTDLRFLVINRGRWRWRRLGRFRKFWRVVLSM